MKLLPVRERAIRALRAAIEDISIANGYNFDVKHVHRKRHIPERAEDPVEVHLLFGETDIDQSYNVYQNKETAQVFAWFILPDTGDSDEDTQYNLFIADLIKKLDCLADGSHDVVDTTHPEGRIVDVYLGKHQPKYAETRSFGGVTVGRLEMGIGYVYIKANPNRWDDEDVNPGVLE